MKFRPCIDIHEGKVKQIVGGTLSGESLTENFTSGEDSSYYAEMYRKDNLQGGHVIMLGRGCEESALRALSAYPGGLQIGGGIHADNAQSWLSAGASAVIVTSWLFDSAELNLNKVTSLSEIIGREKLVIDLSCRKKDGRYFAVKDRWQTFTDFEVTEKSLQEISSLCLEFLIHGVDVEGKKQGLDLELLEILGRSGCPCVYAGGISTEKDIELVKTKGNARVDFTVGSALDIFGGLTLRYSDLKNLK